MELENYVYDKYIKNILKTDGNKKYVLEKDFISMGFSVNERNFVKLILNKRGISIELDVIEKEDRSVLVRDCTYGEVKETGDYDRDIPVMAKIEFNDAKEIIYSDYSKLEEFLVKEFIPLNIQIKKKEDKELKECDYYDSIQLKELLKLGLSELELEYSINYMKDLGITICGYSSLFDGEFENYNYLSTYKNLNIDKTKFDSRIQDELLLEYNEVRTLENRNRVIENNLNLALFLAYRWSCISGIDINELKGYAYEGLIKAVENYDLSMGYKLSSYAVPVIEGYIKKGIADLKGYSGSKRKYFWVLLPWVNAIKEINDDEVQLSYKMIEEVVNAMVESGFIRENEVEKYKQLLLFVNYDSITDYENDYYDENSDVSLAFFEKVELDIIGNNLREVIDETLSPREAKVIKERYGLGGSESCTLEEIGKELDVTGVTIRQIEAKALRKLRHPYRRKNYEF